MGAMTDILAEEAELVGIRCVPRFGVLGMFTQLTIFEDFAGVGVKKGKGGV